MAIQTVIMGDDSVAQQNGQVFIVPCERFPQTVYGIMVHDIFHGSFGTFVFCTTFVAYLHNIGTIGVIGILHGLRPESLSQSSHSKPLGELTAVHTPCTLYFSAVHTLFLGRQYC